MDTGVSFILSPLRGCFFRFILPTANAVVYDLPLLRGCYLPKDMTTMSNGIVDNQYLFALAPPFRRYPSFNGRVPKVPQVPKRSLGEIPSGETVKTVGAFVAPTPLPPIEIGG